MLGHHRYNIAMCSSLTFDKLNEAEMEEISISTVNDFGEMNHKFMENYQKSFYNMKDDNPPVVIDTEASTSITPILSDFISDFKPSPVSEVNYFNGKTQVIRRGTVKWKIRDMWNNQYTYKTEAYYISNAAVRLFSPQKSF